MRFAAWGSYGRYRRIWLMISCRWDFFRGPSALCSALDFRSSNATYRALDTISRLKDLKLVNNTLGDISTTR